MFVPLILLPALLTPATPATPTAGAATEPPVHVWLNSNGEYQQGDEARVYVKAAQDGYLVVLRTDAEGHIRVLFPLDPGEDNFVRGEEKYEIRGRANRDAFEVSERRGNGYVLAAFSLEPFTFDGLVRGDHWDYGAMEQQYGNVNDPEAALLDLAQQMAGDQHFDYDVSTYIAGAPATYYRTASAAGGGWGGWGGWGWNSGCFYCSPFYGGSGIGVFLSFGDSFWYRPWGYWPAYSPFFFSPFRFPHRGLIFAGGYGPYGYMPGYYGGWYGDGLYGGGWGCGGYGDCDDGYGYGYGYGSRRGGAMFAGLGLGVGGVHRVGWGTRGRGRSIPVFLPDRPVGPRFVDPNPRMLTTVERRPVRQPSRATPTERAPQQPRVQAPREPTRRAAPTTRSAPSRGRISAPRSAPHAVPRSAPRARPRSAPRGRANGPRGHDLNVVGAGRTWTRDRPGLRVVQGDPPGQQPTVRREQPRMGADRPGIRVGQPAAREPTRSWQQAGRSRPGLRPAQAARSNGPQARAPEVRRPAVQRGSSARQWQRPQNIRRSAPSPRAVAPSVRRGGSRGGEVRVTRGFSGQRGGARASSPRGGGRRHH